ncbi:hypothetical protein [Spirosoma sordidisoli]|uniref:Uncharacterized protein n=1 Tax=Spirosoma sordidisoli TaxID=2502893 RepID=A0A4Q2UQ35_9BACT|nr:hypothetical protein [Spirosoma sordidisoli]RYC69740.1 hypothetical protein EQG79_14185 [Spirosoma sordidisoli]
MTYNELDINQKINYKAAVSAWAEYAVEHFQTSLDKKVYRVRNTKKGRRQGNKNASGALRRTWYQNVASSGERVVMQFLQYGRYLDMGVGRGTTHTDRLVNRQLRLGATGRVRKAWYSKRKGYEIKRLREILAAQNINVGLDLIENALNITVAINR